MQPPVPHNNNLARMCNNLLVGLLSLELSLSLYLVSLSLSLSIYLYIYISLSLYLSLTFMDAQVQPPLGNNKVFP